MPTAPERKLSASASAESASIYVESSALLHALLENNAELLEAIREAPARVTSILTYLEGQRALWRAVKTNRITREQQRTLFRLLRECVATCDLVHLEDSVLERAAHEFPAKSVGTLDALHLASALLYEQRVGPVVFLSRDVQVRKNAEALGLAVLPEKL